MNRRNKAVPIIAGVLAGLTVLSLVSSAIIILLG